ncbi:MAG: F0F1 ATP synthase subunit gamma [Acidimicrobiia bacterium]
MPVVKLRQIRRRIRSVQSTKKITRAMELIAASRIVRAQGRVAAARPYSEEITKVVANLAALSGGSDHPLLERREPASKVGLIVIGGDRGLAGAYNSSVIRAAEGRLREARKSGASGALFVVGRKSLAYFRFRGYTIERSYSGMSDRPTYEQAREVAADVMSAYESGEVDRVEITSTRFLSAATQRVVSRTLLPVEPPESRDDPTGPVGGYEFEPEPAGILARLLPSYVEARLFAAMLDASASEHAARQRAMKTATDNADDLIKTLTRVANQARQTEITSEIMEIVGGAEALRVPKGEVLG